MITLRFVQTDDIEGWAIAFREETAMPFTPTHVECVVPDGYGEHSGKYLGQHLVGGMAARDPGYDKKVMRHDLFVPLDASPEQTKSFYDYCVGSIGEPYDWPAIVGFMAPIGHFHLTKHAICSAKMLLGLRAKPAPLYKWPTSVPAHLVSPRDLLWQLSAIVHIPLDSSNPS